MSSEFGPSPVL